MSIGTEFVLKNPEVIEATRPIPQAAALRALRSWGKSIESKMLGQQWKG